MQRSSPQPALQLSSTLQRVFNGWDAARDGGCIPFRHALDPRDFGALLDHIFIIEQRSVHDFRFRLCGQKICDQIGMELRGMPAVSLMATVNRQEMTALLEATLDGTDMIKLNVMGTALNMAGEMLLLPLRGPDGQINRILGTLDAPLPICPPNRFEILALEAADLQSMSTHAALAEDFKLFETVEGGAKTRSSSPRPNLRLVS